MKNKRLGIGLAIAIGLFASTTSAQAQIGGQSASGSSDASGASTGAYGQTDYETTRRGATPEWDSRAQNYTSTIGQSSHINTPLVAPMMNSDASGLNRVSSNPLAPIIPTSIPSGQFTYGFNTGGRGAGAIPYMGSYGTGSRGMGTPLPQVSTGSVDFNTVDNSGFVPYGSPMQSMSTTFNSANQMLNSIPSAASSASSIYNGLQSFFGF